MISEFGKKTFLNAYGAYLHLPIRPEITHNAVVKTADILVDPPTLFTGLAQKARRTISDTFNIDDPRLEFRTRVQTPAGETEFRLPNRYGVAAGLAKNAECGITEVVGRMGAGFIEHGTFTLQERSGNKPIEKVNVKGKVRKVPRMLRTQIEVNGHMEWAGHNHMGLNNVGTVKGLEQQIKTRENLEEQSLDKVMGISVAASPGHPTLEKTLDDFRQSLEMVAATNPDYLTVSTYCPNTYGTCDTKDTDVRDRILKVASDTLKIFQPIPVFVKSGPDMTDKELEDFTTKVREGKFSGVIASNTSMKDKGPFEGLPGGASGALVFTKTVRTVGTIKKVDDRIRKDGELPLVICACGGVASPEHWRTARDAGADFAEALIPFIGNPNLFNDLCRAELNEF